MSKSLSEAVLQELEKPLRYGRLRMIAERHGIGVKILYHYVQRMGLAKAQSPEWSEDELSIIRKNLPVKAIERILQEQGYERSTEAIRLKRSRMELAREETYSAASLAGCIGTATSTVVNFINRGYIKATKTANGYTITEEAAALFLDRYPTLYDHGKCDWYWLKGMIHLAVQLQRNKKRI